MDKRLIGESKRLSLLLRHKPEKFGITLDMNGWCDLMELFDENKGNFKLRDLELIIEQSDKPRFELDVDNGRIRAVYGHSLQDVDTQLEKGIPPGELYHGTKEQFLDSIQEDGLLKMNRQYVHMAVDKNLAIKTADRKKGKSILLKIDAMHMRANNHKFYKTDGDIWLTEKVPFEYITIVK